MTIFLSILGGVILSGLVAIAILSYIIGRLEGTDRR